MILPSLRTSALLLATLCLATPGFARGRTLPESIRDVTTDPKVQAVHAASAAQMEAPMDVGVALTLRNVTELQARVSAGENLANGKITQEEYENKYLPLLSDFEQLKASLVSQGLTVVQDDPLHTAVFVRGTAAQMAKAFSVQFARVTTTDGEFTSAVTAPTLPEGAPASTLAVAGLQPHLRAAHHIRAAKPQLLSTSGGYYVGPKDIKLAYSMSSLTLTGSGQTIAIVIDGTVAQSDLTTFWSNGSVSDTAANITQVPFNGGPATTDSGAQMEADLDVSYSSAMAPGAGIRVYEINSLNFVYINQALRQILTDKTSIPSLSVVSMSFGAGETAGVSFYAQTFLQLVTAGITPVASSGDDGSNPTTTTSNGYTKTGITEVNYPASDPNVLGVGGTALIFNNTTSSSGEIVWSDIPSSGPVTGTSYDATGGGVSGVFSKPSWQSDGGTVLSTYSVRCVPDVAAIASGYGSVGNFGVEIVLNGSATGIVGTSLSAPVWAGIVALMNQARANAGQTSVGLVQPTLYTYHASAFTDITSGTNGAYTAGTGYDLCTGLGSPNVAALTSIAAGALPLITSQPMNVAAISGTSANFALTVTSYPTATYQWQREPNGATSWSNLSDSGTYSSTATPSMSIATTTTAMSGDQFRCVVTNPFGSVTSTAASLSVTAATQTSSGSTTTASSGGGGGGGGAPSWVFLALVAALAALRNAPVRRVTRL